MVRRISSNIALVLISTAIACVSVEVLLRAFKPIALPAGVPGLSGRSWIPDKPNGYLFNTNSRGLRTIEFEDAPNPNGLRIVFCGDSHVYGTGVDDGNRMSDHVHRRIASAFATHVEVLNFGFPNATFDGYVSCVQRAVKLGAKSAVVVVYGGNDFSDAVSGAHLGGTTGHRKAPSGFAHVLATIRTLHLYHLVRSAPNLLRNRSEVQIGDDACRVEVSATDAGIVTQALMQACILRQPENQRLARRLAMDALDRMARSQGIGIMLALLPSSLAVGESETDIVAKAGGKLKVDILGATLLERALTKNLADEAKRRKLNVVDLETALAETKSNFFPIDQHLNEQGHRVVGSVIADRLETSLRPAR